MKITEKEKFVVFFTKNTFHYFRTVQNIFFKKNIGWVESGKIFLDLSFEGNCFALFYNKRYLAFEYLDDLHYEALDDEDIFEEYIFFPVDKRKKLFI